MGPPDSDAAVQLLVASTVAVIFLLLLLQVYMVCFVKTAAAQGHLPTSGPLLSARDAATGMADGAGADAGGDAATWASLPGFTCGWGGDEEAGDCVVCLSELGEDGGAGGVRVLPRCGHAFHAGCIGRWLVSHSVRCPICRTSARPDPAASAAAATSPPAPPVMAAPVRGDEEAAGVLGGATGEHMVAARAVVLAGDDLTTEDHYLPLLVLH